MKAGFSHPNLKILYLGDNNPHSTSMHRAEALRRLGCQVEVLNPRHGHRHTKLPTKINNLTGYRLVAPLVHRWLDQQTQGKKFDLVWVDGGYDVPAQSVALLRKRFGPAVNYAVDDPTGPRDYRNWATLRAAIPEYDLCAVVRVESEQEFRLLSAPKVIRIWRSYDEVAHAPFPSEMNIPAKFRSEVAFIGTWMKGEGQGGRDYFLRKLVEAGLPISIWGGRWHRSACWPSLEPFVRGGILGGRDYAAAIQGAKICLGLLSKGNRDLHTTRSAEIPYVGGLFCAERTSEHVQLFQEGEEAVLWSSPEECIRHCRELLKDEAKREQIRAAGMRRIRKLGFGNETMCRLILNELGFELEAEEKLKSFFRLSPPEVISQTIYAE